MRRRLVHAIRDRAYLPGPLVIWGADWVNLPASAITAHDVALLASWSNGWPFWGSLHWLVGDADLGVGGISYVEMLVLFELWAGERLILEKAHPWFCGQDAQFQCRLFLLVQALIFGVLVVSLVLQ